ncbi:hypothetical protein ONS95_011899 [Cadophora gregata]|uniref:uncharacterized protein n=1 Tax=Cadophora gregata TaxID=51156 RepID=UPI0026DCF9CC|nr:uncharacterized protein ONS95_011899 [Cadophora gregata]KAK0117563.1 hypothetical protein ONS95_011899 [Cadophora gregata]
MQRLQDRASNEAEDFVWPIERRDPFHDDNNRYHVLSAALFRIPEHILREYTSNQLMEHVNRLSEDLEARRHEMRADTIALRLARRILVTSTPRDPTGRSLSERAAEALVRRARNIPSLLTAIDISGLVDSEVDRECIICTNAFGSVAEGHAAEEPCGLPCGHVFGRTCISLWLKEHTSCPYCRRNFSAELSRTPASPALIQGPSVAIEPSREISADTRREAQQAQSERRRELRQRNTAEDLFQHNAVRTNSTIAEPHNTEDPEAPAGDSTFQSELAAAVRVSVAQIHQEQLEAREAAHTAMIAPIRGAVRTTMQMTQSGSDVRRRIRSWRIQELESQLADDRMSENAILIGQIYYQDHMDCLDRYLVNLNNEREVILNDMQGNRGENPILRRHDRLLDDTYRLRSLLQQAEQQAELEIQRLRVDIEQAHISIDDAYIHSAFQDDAETHEDLDAIFNEDVVEITLDYGDDDREPRVPNNSPNLEDGEVVQNETEQLPEILL